MSKNEFNDATLKYLTNKNYNVVQVNEINHSEIKFYRKRIIDITKKILHNKIEIDNNIKDVYYDYVNVLIEHFKTSDKHDLIQEEFNNIKNDNNIKLDISNVDSLDSINSIIFKEKKNVSSIDNFVLKKSTTKEVKNFPQEKKIDLKNKKLKLKGIKEKSV